MDSTRSKMLAGLLCSLAVGVGITLVALVAPHLVDFVDSGLFYVAQLSFMVPALTAAVLAGGMGLVIVWRAGGGVDARSIALFLSFLFMFWSAVTVFLISPWAVERTGVIGRGPLLLSMIAMVAGFWLTLGAFVRVSAVFPRVLTPADVAPGGAATSGSRPARPADATRAAWTRRLLSWQVPWLTDWRVHLLDARVVWVAAAGAAALFTVAFLPGMLGFGWGLSVSFGIGFAIAVFALVAGLSRGVRQIRIGMAGADPVARRRARWAVVGLVAAGRALLAAAVIALGPIVGLNWSGFGVIAAALAGLAPLAAVAGIAVAVFYAGTLDPSLALSRTTVYGTLTVIAAMAFAVIEEVFTGLIAERFGLSDRLGDWAAAAGAALLFTILRRPVVRLFGRRPQRGRDRPAGADGADASMR